jgi:hypothetical protein
MFNYLLLIYLFAFIIEIGTPGVFMYGALVVVAVYAFTELMDRNPNAFYMELFKSLSMLAFIFIQGDWFGANTYLGTWFTYIVGMYQVLAVVVVWGFVNGELKGHFKLFPSKLGGA